MGGQGFSRLRRHTDRTREAGRFQSFRPAPERATAIERIARHGREIRKYGERQEIDSQPRFGKNPTRGSGAPGSARGLYTLASGRAANNQFSRRDEQMISGI